MRSDEVEERVGVKWGKIIYLCMNHNFILRTESDRTFGTFEESNQKIVVNVANQIVKASKDFATQLKRRFRNKNKDHTSLLKEYSMGNSLTGQR